MSTADVVEELPPIDTVVLRRCLGQFVTGVTVITARSEDGANIGLTVNSFSSVSLDPPLILWSQRVQAATHPAFCGADRFAVNILASNQADVSQRFGSATGKRFDGLELSDGLGGVPLINECAAYLECKKEAMYPGGDHAIFIGRVERIAVSGKAPLAFGQGKYMVVQPHDLGSLSQDWGQSYAPTLDGVVAAQALLQEFSDEHKVASGLAVWGNHGPTMIRWVNPDRALDIPLRTGLVLPILGSAGGQIFASHLPRALIAPYIEQELGVAGRGHRYNLPRTLEDVDARLATIQSSGVAMVRDLRASETQTRGIDVLSAPVFSTGNRIVMALTIMAHSDQLNDDRRARLSRRLIAQAARISSLQPAADF